MPSQSVCRGGVTLFYYMIRQRLVTLLREREKKRQIKIVGIIERDHKVAIKNHQKKKKKERKNPS